jgi:GNAT superfamily N-acetyltransferase
MPLFTRNRTSDHRLQRNAPHVTAAASGLCLFATEQPPPSAVAGLGSSVQELDVTFRVHRTVPDSERTILFEWGSDIFEGSLYNLQWRPTDYHVIGYLEGHPVTHVGIVAHRVKVGSTKKLVGGIGAVVTVPKHQKRGLAKECLKWAHGYMKSNLRVEFGFLFCPERLLDFYESVGWKRVKENVLVDQPGGKVIAPICAMVLELSEAWPSGPIDLDSYPW